MNAVHPRCTLAPPGTVPRNGDTSQRLMTSMSFPFRRAGLRLLPAWIALALALAPAAGAQWVIEPIGASEGVRELHDLAFDAQGRGLLSWDADLQGNVPPVFGGLAARDPAGGWLRPPNLAGVDPVTAQIHLWSAQRALLVAREGSPAGPATGGSSSPTARPTAGSGRCARSRSSRPGRGRRPTPPATRSSPTRASARRSSRSPSARTAAASARRATWRSGARRPSRSTLAAIACSPGRPGPRIGVRVRRAGGVVESHAAHRPAARRRQPAAVGARRARRAHAHHLGPRPRQLRRGRGRRARVVAHHDASSGAAARRRSARARRPSCRSSTPTGATYVAWTHGTRQANSVTLARVGASGPVQPRRRLAPARRDPRRRRGRPGRRHRRDLGGVLSKENPLLTATYAGLRRSGRRLRGPAAVAGGSIVARGSRVAFHPLTGQAVVAIPFVVGRTLAVGSAISPRATA